MQSYIKSIKSWRTTIHVSFLFRCEGLLVGTIKGGWFLQCQQEVTFIDHQLLFAEGKCFYSFVFIFVYWSFDMELSLLKIIQLRDNCL